MGGVLVQEGERRGEGEIGLLGLDVGAAPAIRGLFHPSLCETVVAAGNVWERKRVTLSLSLSLSLFLHVLVSVARIAIANLCTGVRACA